MEHRCAVAQTANKKEPPMTIETGFIERLCRTYQADLISYLTQLLGRQELAREVARAAFVKLHDVYRPDEIQFPRAVLFKLATDSALTYLRRRRREILGIADIEEAPNDSPHTNRRAAADQIGQHLSTVIKELRPPLRTVFVMAHVQGKPRKDIAAALGISETRVDKRLTKALTKCRERLASLSIDLTDIY